MHVFTLFNTFYSFYCFSLVFVYYAYNFIVNVRINRHTRHLCISI